VKIIGIETSCDETAVAIVENGRKVLCNIIASQIDLHKITGGVVPEIAAREHALKIIPVLEQALNEAKLKLEDIDAIAVTRGPGLLSSLIIGYSAATTLAMVLNKPIIPVHHVSGHIYANWLDTEDDFDFPIMCLTVSGGHNELVLLNKNFEFVLIGETLDDAAGEAFDKIARLLGLSYPGGPAISKRALNGNAKAIKFPRALMKKDNFNFSFSGLKTAVLLAIEEEFKNAGKLSDKFIDDCCASFQEAVCEVLIHKLLSAAKKFHVKEVHLAGGVSANTRLREMLQNKIQNDAVLKNIKFRYTANKVYCTDNAAMIAGAAYFQQQSNQYSSLTNLKPDPQLSLYE